MLSRSSVSLVVDFTNFCQEEHVGAARAKEESETVLFPGITKFLMSFCDSKAESLAAAAAVVVAAVAEN